MSTYTYWTNSQAGHFTTGSLSAGTFTVSSSNGGNRTITIIGSSPTLSVGATVTVDFNGGPIGTGVYEGLVSSGGSNYPVVVISGTTYVFDVILSSGSYGVSSSVICYLSGTQITTARGEVPVEALRIGDLVATRSNGLQPISWIGHREVDCRRHPTPERVWPVRVAAGAFGVNLPRRDLFLSPEHAVFVDGVLIPIRCLINDATIRRQQSATATYWHVELPRHEVMLAEGLECESYLDCGNRNAFSNGGAFMALHPDFSPRTWEQDGCAPLHLSGPVVAAVRASLHRRAEALGYGLSADPQLRLQIDGRLLPRYRVRGNDNAWRFRLPAGGRSVVLLSRTAYGEAGAPGDAGYHPLGVKLAGIVQCAGPQRQEMDLSDPALSQGFYGVEPDGEKKWRWTNGAAVIPLTLPGIDAIDIHVAATRAYLVPPALDQVAAA